MNLQNKHLVCLYGEPNFLSINILENLLSNDCYVDIVSDDIDEWSLKVSHITTKSKFSLLKCSDIVSEQEFEYAVFCGGFTNDKNLTNQLDDFKKNIRNTTKVLYVFPKEKYGILNINDPSISDNVGLVYVSDLLGPRIDLTDNLRISRYIKEMYFSNSLTVPVGEVLHPLFVSDVSRQLVRWLFAFGPFGKEVYVVGSEVSAGNFWQLNSKYFSNLKYYSKGEITLEKIPRNITKQKIDRSVAFGLEETYKWIGSHLDNYKQLSPTKVVKIIKQSNVGNLQKNNVKKISKIALYILIVPIITLVLSLLLTFTSYKLIKTNGNSSSVLMGISKQVSSVGYYESKILKYIPLVGQIYKETEYLSYIFIKISDTSKNVIPLIKVGNSLVKNILGDVPYSIEDLLGSSPDKLPLIYNDVGLLQAKTLSLKDRGSLLALYVNNKFNFEEYKNYISQFEILFKDLPNILGDNDSKTYLVLFQNNMELRPTGGFIGSYGLITFDGGRMSDFAISDIYSADGQLNGHVEPPQPIKDHLGEANWWFRDSNWDPDFPTSAKRAEWFLSKEMDKEVDGVFAIDLSPIKDFLEVGGPIFLPDYNVDINSSNLYEKVQSEVQDNFFPGTYKKGSFLTSLSKSILNQMESLTKDKIVKLLRIGYDNLNARHIQLFLHNQTSQNALSKLGWDGGVVVPMCQGECFSDIVGIVEANVGVNKSNYYIKRAVSLNIDVKQGVLDKTLVLTLNNSANTSLGVSGRYKSYIRLLIPENSNEIKVSSQYGQNYQVLTPEITDARGRKEVGVLFEVLPGESKMLVYSWKERTPTNIKQYYTYYRKQAGVEDYPVTINLTTPLKVLGSTPQFTLTNQGNYVYNTTLAKDLLFRFSL